MGAKVCIFNRTLEHAQFIADKYGYESCQLDSHCVEKLDEYSTLIIQTTSLGNRSIENCYGGTIKNHQIMDRFHKEIKSI